LYSRDAERVKISSSCILFILVTGTESLSELKFLVLISYNSCHSCYGTDSILLRKKIFKFADKQKHAASPVMCVSCVKGFASFVLYRPHILYEEPFPRKNAFLVRMLISTTHLREEPFPRNEIPFFSFPRGIISFVTLQSALRIYFVTHKSEIEFI